MTTTSIGIAVFPEDARDFENLAQRADIAMHRAKQEGGNGYRFFTATMQPQPARILQLENALRQARHDGEPHLRFQPQLGAISPAEFIPIAESSGLILPIGEWVLRRAARHLSDWLAQAYLSGKPMLSAEFAACSRRFLAPGPRAPGIAYELSRAT